MNLETIERIVAMLDDYPVREIELSSAGSRIAVKRGAAVVVTPPPASEPSPVSPEPITDQTAVDAAGHENAGTVVVSEIVGIFHHLRTPVLAGAAVTEGQALGQIESMKLLHEVTAPVAGAVAEVLLDDGHAVEYGSALFRIIPA